jgi:hypothetical protein
LRKAPEPAAGGLPQNPQLLFICDGRAAESGQPDFRIPPENPFKSAIFMQIP